MWMFSTRNRLNTDLAKGKYEVISHT